MKPTKQQLSDALDKACKALHSCPVDDYMTRREDTSCKGDFDVCPIKPTSKASAWERQRVKCWRKYLLREAMDK